MKYKLLVLDVDGTLLNNQKEDQPRYHGLALLKAIRSNKGSVYLYCIRKTD